MGQKMRPWAGLARRINALNSDLRDGAIGEQLPRLRQWRRLQGVTVANGLPAHGGGGRREAPGAIQLHQIGSRLKTDARKITEVIHRVVPALLAVALTSPGRSHHVEANQSVSRVVTDPRDAADRFSPQPGEPDALALGLSVDGHITNPRSKTLTPGHSVTQGISRTAKDWMRRKEAMAQGNSCRLVRPAENR